MFHTKFPNSVIKQCYLNVFDESKPPEDRKIAARGVVDTIINGVYFENIHIYELFNDINKGIGSRNDSNKSKNKEHYYNNSFTGKLKFLYDKEFITGDLVSQYEFINSEGGQRSKAHPRFKKGNNRVILIIQIYLNNILESLLDQFEESKDYLIPLHVIEKKNAKLYNKVINRIDSFWNIKKDKPWYKKYGTIIRFSLIIFFLFIWPIAIAICIIEINNTKTLVFDPSLKRKRNWVYNSLLIFTIFIGFSNIYIFNLRANEKDKFDPYPLYTLKSTVGVVSENDTILRKYIDFIGLRKDEKEKIVIYHVYRNIGFNNIIFPTASLRTVQLENEILFIGILHSLNSTIIDTVSIKNIKEPYNIKFINGDIYSPFDSVYKNYGYYKDLDSKEYLISSEDLSLYNGIQFIGSLDSHDQGLQSRGGIYSTFLIEKK